MGLTATAAGDARLNQRLSFDVPFSVIFLAALHGLSILKIVSILYVNYCIAKKLPRAYIPVATWVFGVGILFANDMCKGYSFASIMAVFLPSSRSETGPPSTNFGHTLDGYGGLIPRWEVLFNFTVLRLISFNLDYYWSTGSNAGSLLEVCIPFIFHLNTLMTVRRNSSIQPISLSAIECLFLLMRATFAFETTLRIPCTLRYI